VFEEIAGLPLHPLAVHAVVVLVPLSVVVTLCYALVPRFRARLEWAVVALAVLAPASAVVAVLSGDAFARRRALPLEGALADHRDLGRLTMIAALVLGVVTLVLVWSRRLPRSRLRTWTVGALTVVVVLAAVAAGISAVRSGDSGARMVWGPIWELVNPG